MIASNYQSFDVLNAKQLETPKAQIAVVDPEGSLTKFLKEKNINFVPFNANLDKDIPVFCRKSHQKE